MKLLYFLVAAAWAQSLRTSVNLEGTPTFTAIPSSGPSIARTLAIEESVPLASYTSKGLLLITLASIGFSNMLKKKRSRIHSVQRV
jgi:hypothetical protein